MAKRGMLTEEIKSKSKELLGYEINVTELRLIPHIHYLVTNEQKIKFEKVNHAEIEILNKWDDEGYIYLENNNITISKNFWNIICELIYMAYVDIEKGEEEC